MTLSGRTRLGHYEIIRLLGSGGMGEVYRATDTKLHRDVALKVLPEEFSRDADRMARLEREAQILASLNHPNIAAIHGLEESNGVRALAMELVEGPTLAERIAAGPIPIDEALTLAKQIAAALEYAHDRGIIHRDLKPANVKVTADGAVKVLDFGLAKVLEDERAAVDATKSPTLTLAATARGVILGTAAYMPPEQARGKPADKRSDIWAFGCVLYEMLAGTRAFQGETVSDILAAVLRADIDWRALPETTPASVHRLLRRCLDRDPKRRLQAVGEARIVLEDPLTGWDTAAIETATAPRPPWQRSLPWAVAATALAFALLAWSPWKKPPKPALPMRLSVQMGADVHLGSAGGARVILSPDGERLAFVGRGTDQKWNIFVRPLDRLNATSLPGTQNARNLFFSPNGQWIAFFAEGKLKKISVQGEGPVTLCNSVYDLGGSWGDDDTIVFTVHNLGGVYKVSSTGGTPEPLTTLDQKAGEITHRYPHLLPGSKAIIFTAHNSLGNFDDAMIVAQSLETGIRKTVVTGGYYGRYAPSGHLVYIHEGALFAVPFDLGRLEITGQRAPVSENVAIDSASGAQFDISQTGTLVYLPHTVAAGVSLHWMDQAGKMTPLLPARGNYLGPRVSPDGKRLAVVIDTGSSADIWIYEWQQDRLTRLTFDGGNHAPIWTPDGGRIAFGSEKDGAPNIYWRRADGAGDAQRLTESKNSQIPYSWHPDGKILAFFEMNPRTGGDIWMLPLKGDEQSGWAPGKPELFLGGPAVEVRPVFSPDGRWVAYNSNESGKFEIYVRPFFGPGGKRQISMGGGVFPTWSPNGKELFYRTDDQRIWVCTYSASEHAFEAGRPRLWSQGQFTDRGVSPNFAIAPDGKRFAVLKAPDVEGEFGTDKVVFVLNFFDELRRVAPVRKK
ncbi:MAG: protein kinase domain-containing protein [Acidobacteriota bacterium]